MGSLGNTAYILPQGSWDCHHHIFEPQKFAYAATRHLTTPPATTAQYMTFKNTHGITNSFLTHGLSYGSDNTSLLAFIQALGGSANTLGIAVIEPESTLDEELAVLRAAGVRGIRVNLYRYGALESADKQVEVLRTHARRLKDVCPDWSMAFTTTKPENWTRLRPLVQNELANTGIRLVTDHVALLKGTSMLDEGVNFSEQPGFDDITALVRAGLLWVKLSAPYRLSELGPGYADLKPLVRALIDANPRRVIWGSDWPHTPRMKVRSHEDALKETPFLKVDDGIWIKTLRSWVSNEEWENIMIRNPRELYGISSRYN